MTDTSAMPAQPDGHPARASKDPGRAGRNLPVAIASGLALGAAIIVSLVFWKTAFMLIVGAAVVVAIWELHQGLKARDIDIPQEPLMIGGVVMVGLRLLRGHRLRWSPRRPSPRW